MYPVTLYPQWPTVNDYPETKRVKRIDLEQNTWGRIRAWLFKTPLFVVTEDYFVYSDYLKKWIYVPKNFVYDYASTRIFGFILRPHGVLALGSLPHDFGYRFGGLMVSSGVHEAYYFQEYTQLEIDRVLEELTDDVSGLSFIGDIVTWFLTNAGRWGPIPMIHIDWDYYVMPRRFYDKEGYPKFSEIDNR